VTEFTNHSLPLPPSLHTLQALQTPRLPCSSTTITISIMTSSPPPAAATAPSDEEVGVALLEAARYGDLEDLQELTKTYGTQHLAYRGAHGNNTALHYGE